MNASAKTAPSGALVPPAVRETCAVRGDALVVTRGRDAAMACLNVITEQSDMIQQLRSDLRASRDEVAGLKRHIEAMGAG